MVKKSLILLYRAAFIALWLIIIVLASSVLAMRYVVLPHIDEYKDIIAGRASQTVGHKVSISNIAASWDGLNPHFSLTNVELYDEQNRSALVLSHIGASLSWLSIPLLEPRLSSISIDKPELTIRREADGTLYVAGIAMSGPSKPELTNWALRQSQIDVLDATVLWQDDLRHAPPLTLNRLHLQILNPAWEGLLGHHRFGLRATLSAGSSQPIDLRGDIYGSDVGKIKNWHGTLYGKAEGTDIAAWRNWVSYPFDLREGFGAARFWLNFAEGEIKSITSDVILSNVKTRFAKNSPEATLDHLSGRLKWTQHADGQELRAEHLKLATADGLNMQNGTIGIREQRIAGKQWLQGDFRLDEINLETLNAYVAYFPLPAETFQQLREMAPVGKLQKVEMHWKAQQKADGNYGLPNQYTLRSSFSGLGLQPYGKVPGFTNLNGSIDANETTGSLILNSQQAMLDLQPLLRQPIPADRLNGQVKWTNSKNKTDFRLINLVVSNAHLAGTINGSYLHNGIKGGYLDLNAKFTRADGKFIHFYYPTTLGPNTLQWLDDAVLAGHGEDINVIVKGSRDDFPYPNNKLGLFKATAKVTGGILEYGSDWPKIEDLKMDMLFEGARMELTVTGGSILGNQISHSKVMIPVMNASKPVLDLVGEGGGPVSEGIQYINSSPLLKVFDDFTADVKTSGQGKLHLELHIPLEDLDAIKVKGAYAIANGSLAIPALPELTRLNAKLEFTESSLRVQNAGAWLYGGPVQFGLLAGKDSPIRIAARGRIGDDGIKQAFGPGLADRISGNTDWTGDFNIHQSQVDMSIRSSLVGMASTLPAPLAKTAAEHMPLRFEKRQQSAQQDTLNISLASVIGAKLLRTEQNGTLQIERGEIGLNVLPELPAQRGLSVRGVLDKLDVDEWRNLFDTTAANNGASAATSTPPVSKVDLTVKVLDVFDRRINDLKLMAHAVADGWQINMQSREITGDAQWNNVGNGKISAKLKTLIAPAATPGTLDLRTQGNFRQQAQQYPALDIVADNFEINKKQLGRLELQASEQNEDWSIEKLRIVNPDSVLNAEGEWHNWKHKPNTRINLTWTISDVGNTLERYGYPGVIKGGQADLSGQLKWPGSPHEFDIPGLGGNLQLDARQGQILQIKSGVGRLFSVLSLQNLPRRLTFDFRDVFSKGFTFDKVNASIKIEQGIMSSNDFRMQGPVALVEMQGQTDLQKETQHLYVKVTPNISDSLSIAALAGGPAVAAAAWLAQKLLKDPINKLAADDYEIIGTWDKPIEVGAKDKKPAVAAPSPLGSN